VLFKCTFTACSLQAKADKLSRLASACSSVCAKPTTEYRCQVSPTLHVMYMASAQAAITRHRQRQQRLWLKTTHMPSVPA
jgi:hypothetical protein